MRRVEYELRPLGNQKSFYGKAVMVHYPDESLVVLESYGTEILAVKLNGSKANSIKKLWDGYSYTTQKHIKSFCGMNKKAFDVLPLGEWVDFSGYYQLVTSRNF